MCLPIFSDSFLNRFKLRVIRVYSVWIFVVAFGLEFFEVVYFVVFIELCDGYAVKCSRCVAVVALEIPFDDCCVLADVDLFDIPFLYGSFLVPVVEPLLDLPDSSIFRTVAFAVDDIVCKYIGQGFFSFGLTSHTYRVSSSTRNLISRPAKGKP